MAHVPRDLNLLYNRMREVSTAVARDAAALTALVASQWYSGW